MPPTTRNGHTTNNHYKQLNSTQREFTDAGETPHSQKPNPKLKITKIHEMHIAHKT